MSGPTADCPPCAPRSSGRAWRLLGRVCRYAVGAFFLVAAVGKVTDLSGFRDYLAVQAGLSPPAAFAVAAVLPWLELVCGLCLVTGRAAREAALLTAMLLVAVAVEAFWSSANWLPPAVKYDAAAVCWTAVLGYFAFQGRRAG